MGTSCYLDEVLRRYSSSFDLYKDYSIDDEKYPAYGYFFSLGEKYVLKKEATLWSIRAYEHVLFCEVDTVTTDYVNHLYDVIKDHVEPKLVRKGEKYPEKDHMVSYLTMVVISKNTPDEETIKAIRKFHFDKGYLLNFRGHSEGGLLCACLDSRNIYTNRSAKRLYKMFDDVFRYLDEKAS